MSNQNIRYLDNQIAKNIMAATGRRRQGALALVFKELGQDKYKIFIDTHFPRNSAIHVEAFQVAQRIMNRGRGRGDREILGSAIRRLQQRQIQTGHQKPQQPMRRNVRALLGVRAIQATIHKSPGDGNCLFTSLAQGLHYNETGTFLPDKAAVQKGLEVRRAIVKGMLESPKDHIINAAFEHSLITDAPTNEAGFEKLKALYSKKMSKNGVYGGYAEYSLFTKLYNTPVIVFIPGNGMFVRHRNFESLGGTRRPILLLYTGREPSAHYDVLHTIQLPQQSKPAPPVTGASSPTPTGIPSTVPPLPQPSVSPAVSPTPVAANPVNVVSTVSGVGDLSVELMIPLIAVGSIISSVISTIRR